MTCIQVDSGKKAIKMRDAALLLTAPPSSLRFPLGGILGSAKTFPPLPPSYLHKKLFVLRVCITDCKLSELSKLTKTTKFVHCRSLFAMRVIPRGLTASTHFNSYFQQHFRKKGISDSTFRVRRVQGPTSDGSERTTERISDPHLSNSPFAYNKLLGQRLD